jgi:hypothetical protein
MRDKLLGPHVARFEVWEQLAASLNQVWTQLGIDDAIEQLKWLRSPINTSDVVSGTGGKFSTLPQSTVQDRTTLVLTADLLGFRYYETTLLDAQDYLKLCRHLAEYYANDKGTPAWTDFLGWCLNANFDMIPTWTQDYKTFLSEGDPTIGASVADGGTWYPTTHMVLEYDQTKFVGVPTKQLVEFFNYFANINIVIWMTQLGGTENIRIKTAMFGQLECVYPGSII